MRRTQYELGNFCQYFDLSLPKLTCNGSYSKLITSKPNKPHHKRIAHKYIKKNIFIPKLSLTIKRLLKSQQNLFIQNKNPNQNLTKKTLHVTNMARKAIPLDSVESIQN